MFDDELEPRNKPQTLKNLEPMSLDELMKYIEELNEEIKRAETEIERKKVHNAAASSIFK